MDAPVHNSFDALQQAFNGFHVDKLGLTTRVSPSLKRRRHTTHVQRTVPATVASIPDETPHTDKINEGALPVRSDDDDNAPLDNGTTPTLEQHRLVRQDSGLPPTPPTMANSDIAELQPERGAGPNPMFADRIRNALQSHKSGRRTPINDLANHSPPTPDASPLRKENLGIPRPPLMHYPSSYADSFKTATEGLSANGSNSRVHSPAQDFTSELHKTWYEHAQQVRQAGIGLGLDLQNKHASKLQGYESATSCSRRGMYAVSSPDFDCEPESQRRNREPAEPFPDFDQNLTEASEAGEARKKNYPASSPEPKGGSEWLGSINPKLIAAALRPEPSPVASPVHLSASKRPLSSSTAQPVVNPKLIKAALRPELSPKSSPVDPYDELPTRLLPLKHKPASADTFSVNAKSDDSPDDYTPELDPWLTEHDKHLAAFSRRRNEEHSAVDSVWQKKWEDHKKAQCIHAEADKKVPGGKAEASRMVSERLQGKALQPGPVKLSSEQTRPEAKQCKPLKLSSTSERMVAEANREAAGAWRLFDAEDNKVAATWGDDEGQLLRKHFGLANPDLIEDSDRGEVRVKNYMESDSDRDRTRPNSSDGPPSPSWQKPLPHQAALHKLRKPIQPGDDIKRPDEALLYSSSIPWKRAKVEASEPEPEPRQPTPPRREMDSEFLRTGNVLPTRRPILREDIISSQSQEGIIEDPETPDSERETQMPDPGRSPQKLREFSPTDAPADVSSPPTSADTPGPAARNLREFAPCVPPAEVESPPTTAAKETLVSNNRVYKVIQEENAKRHSIVSNGSAVQALLMFPAEGQKRKLRHTPKRESLRAGISTASLSKPNSEDSMHTPKLRHKRGMDSIGSSEATSAPTPERFERRIRTEPIKLPSARVASPAGNGIAEDPMRPKKISAMPSNVKGAIMKPPKLRRTLRDQTLDRHSVSFDLSAQQGAASETISSPRLRKTSRGDRLDNNLEVRRTSLYGEAELISRSTSPELRKFSKEDRLENDQEVRRTSQGRVSQLISHDMDLKLDRLASDLTSAGREMQDRCSIRDRRTSSESKHPTSPRRKSFDPRLLNQIGTPLSISLSERTAVTEAEFGLAKGVEIHQHNNDSLLLIHGRSSSYDQDHALSDLSDWPLPSIERDYDSQAGALQPTFQAVVESPVISPNEIIGLSKHHVDSPLTNPRAAPAPPAIQFIPPTPNEELERSLSGSAEQKKPEMQRNLSWSQRAKRFSSNLVQPLEFGRGGSLRRPKRVVTEPAQRRHSDSRLSPMWVPRAMSELYSDSDDDYDDDDDDDHLPAGGDTSDVHEHYASGKRKSKSFFPRSMSVRMPGFRGNGGFLVGNSLGLDRHGTNNRRHYIAKRTSEEMLRRAKQRRRRTFTLPFSGGKRVEYVGLGGLSEHLQSSRQRKEERAAEKRREALRRQIGTRVFHAGEEAARP
ncbi:hypothetical protein DOTSEDRAFT_70658 [Dothistroma septosporum NZE10]|uniref:Uncharacterized protein n=1 Tax=Dothistroma septosporum (strain NZE10 / CBS 128990) TaxID=675120 RepID=N1PWH4_DOTSN|nr:hypothetical protein DOTSEDRAFT_70658 [Dothistroma septosporum NZE10]